MEAEMFSPRRLVQLSGQMSMAGSHQGMQPETRAISRCVHLLQENLISCEELLLLTRLVLHLRGLVDVSKLFEANRCAFGEGAARAFPRL